MEITPAIKDPCLVRIQKINMPEYSGVSFVSKVRMFLDPENYPVLDKNIAKFGKRSGFTILKDLRIGTRIDITNKSESIYKNWAAWCRGTACLVNSEPSSSHQNLRAVDVERGIFHLAGVGLWRRSNQSPTASTWPKRLKTKN